MKPKIVGLNLPYTDEALEFLDRYGFNCEKSGVPSGKNNLFSNDTEIQKTKLITQLEDLVLDEPTIVIGGDGDYHHFTYGLCKKIDLISADYTVFLFDQHMDASCISRGTLNCGNYVPSIIYNTHGKNLIAIGIESMLDELSLDLKILDDIQVYTAQKIQSTLPLYKKPKNDVKSLNKLPKASGMHENSRIMHYNIHWKNIEEEGIESITDSALEHTKTEDVYITVDLDVLHEDSVDTKWGSGHLHLDYLLYSIDNIIANKNLIGADITGYCGNDYEDGSQKTLYSIAAIARALSGESYSEILTEKERNRK